MSTPLSANVSPVARSSASGATGSCAMFSTPSATQVSPNFGSLSKRYGRIRTRLSRMRQPGRLAGCPTFRDPCQFPVAAEFATIDSSRTEDRMGKHILDRQRRRPRSQVLAFSEVSRRTAPEGSNPAAKYLLRKRKGPCNDFMRALAFLRIDRGATT